MTTHNVQRGDDAEECCVGHMDGDERACRKCLRCHKWLRPKDWDAECLGVVDAPPKRKEEAKS